MNYGPLEFAAYLRRKGAGKREPATVEAARAAAPQVSPQTNRLTIISGPKSLVRVARSARIEAVSVYEAVAQQPWDAVRSPAPVRVIVRPAMRPLVLVLSSYQRVHWDLAVGIGAELKAVLLSGYGESTVAGAGNALVASIGGFYAFKRGSIEFEHLEREVMRCTGRGIERFHSLYAGREFEIGID